MEVRGVTTAASAFFPEANVGKQESDGDWMREFIVKVNGRSYQVEVEEVLGKDGVSPNQTETKPPANLKSAAAIGTPTKAGGGVGSVNAPLPGTILEISVEVGDQVQRGDLLMLLEAMKMQNEIVSPADGIVEAIHVSQGQQVERDAILLVIN
jgi:biotin carboxyl carrier protein